MSEMMLVILLFLPFIGFILNGTIGKFLPKNLSGIISSSVILGSFVIAVLYFKQSQSNPAVVSYNIFNWFRVGNLSVSFGLVLDRLSLLWVLFITGIGFLIHIYSIAYMKEDKAFARFFSYLNLFIFFMLVLVLGNNLLITFIGWEGVGLCSYLLIGFWYNNQEYNKAANKAFIMNRIGDLFFLIATFLIVYYFGTLEYSTLASLINQVIIPKEVIIAITLCIFLASTGKSAQLPLYTWLPDAMAGPTPVSALIHAATMVTSGIYIICRLYFLFDLAPETLNIIGYVGGITCIFSATIAILQNDIKKILAYSTVSQLGLMFIAIGVGAYNSAIFHVITHAFFKACLFLGAGSVIHALHHEQDIRKMGGLKQKLPITFATFLVATIAIAGFPPFAGFFSKDEILLHVFEKNKILWLFASIGSILTAFYMFRLLYLVFFTTNRGTEEQYKHAHESPSLMTIPLIILAAFSIFVGLLGIPAFFGANHFLNIFLTPVIDLGHKIVHLSILEELGLMFFAVISALVSLSLAYFMYIKNKKLPANNTKELSAIQKLVYNKYYIDEIYSILILEPLKFISKVFSYFFEELIVTIVNLVGKIAILTGRFLNIFQTGNIGSYILMMVLGISIMMYFIILM